MGGVLKKAKNKTKEYAWAKIQRSGIRRIRIRASGSDDRAAASQPWANLTVLYARARVRQLTRIAWSEFAWAAAPPMMVQLRAFTWRALRFSLARSFISS